MIEADLHEHYRIDLDEPGLLDSRSWRWLRTRVLGLFSVESRTARAFAPPDTAR